MTNKQNSQETTDEESIVDDDDFDDELRENLWGAKEVKFMGITFQKSTVAFLKLSFIFVALLLIGGGAFHAFEYPKEQKRLAKIEADFYDHQIQIIQKIHAHKPTGKMHDTILLYESLREHHEGFRREYEKENLWNYLNSVVFTFTIITTIGYGTFSPITVGGQMFLILYGLVGIPVAAISLGYIAERVLYIFTLMSQVGRDRVAVAFRQFDEDDSGELDKEEFRAALKLLEIQLSEQEFRKVWNEVDKDRGGQIDVEEFRLAVSSLNADLTEAARKKNQVKVTLIAIFVWIILGVVVFSLVEGWRPDNTFYFLFVSLTTIGLGDYIPETKFGSIFLIIFAMVGLGLVAVLIKLLQGFFTDLEAKREKIFIAKKELRKKRKQLQQISFFSNLSNEELDRVSEKMQKVHFASNVEIMKEGNTIDEFLVLFEGDVVLSRKGSQVTKILSAPALLMESAITNDPNSPIATGTIIAGSKVEIHCFSREDYISSLDVNIDSISDDNSVHIGIIPGEQNQ